MPAAVELTGDDLAISDVWDVAVDRRPVLLGARGRERAAQAREFLESEVGDHTYGVNTGFGRFVSESIPPEQAAELQLRLLRSHACGVGEPYTDDVVRAAMLLRANTLAKGFSGARVQTIELLVGMLDAGIVPRVPSRGSVGASGDLAPLAHLALPLVGEGEATVDGRLLPGAEALDVRQLTPITLAAKEGLSLINGTQFMTAMASLALVRAQRLARVADVACAMSVEALQGTPMSFHAAIHAARPLPGQGRSAATLRALLDGSAIVEAHRWCDKVQDAYSLRCAPQVHGASRDLLDHVDRTVAVELNAATDNPLVLLEEGLIVSNGNFHGQPIAIGLDCLAIACAELANISERRTERLVNPSLSDGLPPFLVAREEGLNSGFMIPQYVAAALVSENKPSATRARWTRSRPARARRITSRWETAQVSRRSRSSRTRSACWRSSSSQEPRPSSFSPRSSPESASGPPAASCARCRSAFARTGRSPRTSSASRRLSARAACLPKSRATYRRC